MRWSRFHERRELQLLERNINEHVEIIYNGIDLPLKPRPRKDMRAELGLDYRVVGIDRRPY